jgi:hypothetical protein
MPINITFSGDTNFGCLFENYNRGVYSKILKGINPFEHLVPVYKNADLNILNLECVLSEISDKREPYSWVMRVPESYAGLLGNNRVNIVNLANNHSLDHGRGAFERMTAALDASGIKHFGEARDRLQQEPLVLTVKDTRLAFLGYYIEETVSPADYSVLVKQIQISCLKAKSACDFLILSLHWGHEYTSHPMAWQVALAKDLFLNHGVDILYGHHPHRLHGIARFRSSLFVPSLGNFVFDEYLPANRKTAVLSVTLEKSRGILTSKLIPFYINKRFQPESEPSMQKELDQLNASLQQMIEKTPEELHSQDMINRKESRKGHLINRVKIRILFMIHILHFLPFIPVILNRKHTHV